jgi:hypothetical protein
MVADARACETRARVWVATDVIHEHADDGSLVVAQSPVEQLAFTMGDAAASLGVSPDFFHEHAEPELGIVRRGRKKLVSVRELQEWLDEFAERTLPAQAV